MSACPFILKAMSSETRTRFTIRRATSKDAADIAALQKAIYDEARWFVGDGPPSVEAITRRLRSLEPTLSLYLVASGDEGETGAWLELNRLAPAKLQHVAVLTLAVAAPYRRRGLAGTLLTEAERWGLRVGVTKITLNVRANNEAALNLYQQHGFVLEGRERDHIRLDDGYEDNLIMAKFLESDGD